MKRFRSANIKLSREMSFFVQQWKPSRLHFGCSLRGSSKEHHLRFLLLVSFSEHTMPCRIFKVPCTAFFLRKQTTSISFPDHNAAVLTPFCMDFQRHDAQGHHSSPSSMTMKRIINYRKGFFFWKHSCPVGSMGMTGP